MTQALSSSTALGAEKTARLRHLFDSAATAPPSVPDIYRVFLSAETPLRRLWEPTLSLPAERHWLLAVEDMLQQHAQRSVQRAIELAATHPFVSFRTFTMPATTAANIIVLRPAVMPITGLSPVLSSTDAELGASQTIRAQVSEAVGSAAEEWFEDGIESKFSRALSSLLHAHSVGAIAALETFVIAPSTNVEVAVEAAKWLGAAEDAATTLYRRSLLEKLLTAPSARLRHGAAEGLASMDDPASLGVLRGAIARETNISLREYLQLVVDQLEHTTACPSS